MGTFWSTVAIVSEKSSHAEKFKEFQEKAGQSACEREGGRGDTYYIQTLGLSPSEVTLNCVQYQ